jgi:hypothetical protein
MVFDDGYWYSKFSAGQGQPVYVRRNGSKDAPEEVARRNGLRAARVLGVRRPRGQRDGHPVA